MRRSGRSRRSAIRRRARSRGSGTARRSRIGAVRAPRLVPPEPAEHVHRPADAADVRRGPPTRPATRGRRGSDGSAERPTAESVRWRLTSASQGVVRPAASAGRPRRLTSPRRRDGTRCTTASLTTWTMPSHLVAVALGLPSATPRVRPPGPCRRRRLPRRCERDGAVAQAVEDESTHRGPRRSRAITAVVIARRPVSPRAVVQRRICPCPDCDDAWTHRRTGRSEPHVAGT